MPTIQSTQPIHQPISTTDVDPLTNIAATLTAEARQRELDLAALAPDDHDPATLAHQDGVRRVLTEIRAAQARLATGRYGICTGCHGPIPPERLELRPWAPHCVACAGRAARS